MGEFAGRHVVVTGGAMGIGRGIVESFAAEGASVVFADRNGEAGAEACEEICRNSGNPRIAFVQADLSQPDGVNALAACVNERLGHADVLVNNVGVNFRGGDILQHSEEDFANTYQTNIMSCVRCIQAFLPRMLERERGSVVSISSTMALGAPGFSAYSWSKGSVDTLTRTLALEYAAAGIRFNAVAPGLVATPATLPWMESQTDPADAKGIPMRRAGTPRDIAEAVMFLASDRASYITGQILYVDGGLSVGE